MMDSRTIPALSMSRLHDAGRTMSRRLAVVRRLASVLMALAGSVMICSASPAGETADWWNSQWRMRTTVSRPTPCRDDASRVAEVAIDFPLLLEQAGVKGQFDSKSLRVVCHNTQEGPRAVPFSLRTEPDITGKRTQFVLAWTVRPNAGQVATYDVYFDTTDRRIEPVAVDSQSVPSDNLLRNAGFEQLAGDMPAAWTYSPSGLIGAGRFRHTSGDRSLKIVVDGDTPSDVGREVTVSQKVDVREFAGQDMLFACDLQAERAVYGAPVCIELEQYRADGTRILEYAIEPRWLTLELAEGQFVELSQRGRFSHEAATVDVRIRFRCSVRDADTSRTVDGPESWFTVWLDQTVLRPGERWPWPAATGAGFVEGAMEDAPVNRALECTGLRRVAFNGASEGTLTAGQFNPDDRSVHWGLQAGTLEFWCRPAWKADDGREHVFFKGVAYGHRLQSELRKLDARGDNQLEFTLADAGGTRRIVRGKADLEAGRWHHMAVTWDFPAARLALFVDGQPIATRGPEQQPWPSSLVSDDNVEHAGMGISEKDRRSLPMQAFIGGDEQCGEERSADAALDELRISSVTRYSEAFAPRRTEFEMDEHTRALFHFENAPHGVHDSDDRFVRGHLACELPPQAEAVPLETLANGKIDCRMVVVRPYAAEEQFESNRAESRLTATRPFVPLPDPRRVEYRERQVERVVAEPGDELMIEVGGDFAPLMESVTFEHADAVAAKTTLLPRWRANENVVPFSVETIAATLAPGVEDNTEKAFEIFRYAVAVTNYYDAHYCETLPTRHRDRVSYSLIKALNIYPFDQCGPLNYTLRKLFLAGGISSNDASGTHHQFQQAFYDGDYRLFDLSPRIYWLERDNATVASRRDFEEDLYLKLRQGSGVTSALRGRVGRAQFGGAERPHDMDFSLRPGESASVCWHNEGRWFELAGKREPIPLAKIPPYFGNGALVFEPTGTDDALLLDNLKVDRSGDGPAVLQPIDSARAASLVYHAACPYIFSDAMVEGTYRAQKIGGIRASLSFDEGKTWTEVWRNDESEGPVGLNLRNQVSARYAYWLKLDFTPAAEATVVGFKVRSTFVVSPLSLPGKLALGKNRVRFVGGPVTSPVRTVCRWVERYRTESRISLNSTGYYINGDEARRDVFVVAPGKGFPVHVTLGNLGGKTEVSLENLPVGWSASPPARAVDANGSDGPTTVEFLVQTGTASEGTIYAFHVVSRQGDQMRRIPVQVLVAEAPLAAEAEQAAELAGNVKQLEDAELSGAGGVRFEGEGELAFQIDVPRPGRHALWFRARWNPDADLAMRLGLNGEAARKFSPTSMIGFTDWTNPRQAHTKMFAHFGEQYGHWSWYRLPDIELAAGRQTLTVGASHGTCLDALLLLPQTDAMDRAAMNLLQNWNYAPWANPY